MAATITYSKDLPIANQLYEHRNKKEIVIILPAKYNWNSFVTPHMYENVQFCRRDPGLKHININIVTKIHITDERNNTHNYMYRINKDANNNVKFYINESLINSEHFIIKNLPSTKLIIDNLICDLFKLDDTIKTFEYIIAEDNQKLSESKDISRKYYRSNNGICYDITYISSNNGLRTTKNVTLFAGGSDIHYIPNVNIDLKHFTDKEPIEVQVESIKNACAGMPQPLQLNYFNMRISHFVKAFSEHSFFKGVKISFNSYDGKYGFIKGRDGSIRYYMFAVGTMTKISNIIKLENLDECVCHDFIHDLFHLYPQLQEYSYSMNDEGWGQYGAPHDIYTRMATNPNIIECEEGSSECNYSGSTSYYDIEKNKLIYANCGCFFDPVEASASLEKHDSECEC